MTRINTNVSSLNAQKSLARSNAQLQEALTRLSTGLRINSGKDDPAGLIASEMLRSDITSTERAITNSQRANQMIATADSALGQVSSLLNDVRGLVSEAANTGAMSSEQIAANQLQVDSSLVAIDRIAQVTQFQGKRLLDGSLDFITEDVDATKISNMAINQANFGTLSEIGVSVDVIAQATKGQLNYASNSVSGATVLEIGGASGFEAFNFAAGSTVAQMADAINLVSDALGVEASLGNRIAETAQAGKITVENVGGADSISIVADETGQYAGDYTINYIKDSTQAATQATASWNAGSPNVVDVYLDTTTWDTATAAAPIVVTTNAVDGNGTIAISANYAGAMFSGVQFTMTTGGGTNTVSYDYEAKTISIDAANGQTATQIAAHLTAALGNLFTFTVAGGADTKQDADNQTIAATTGGADGDVVTATSANVAGALNAGAVGAKLTATDAGGGGVIDLITHSGLIGDVNAGNADDPNNQIQLTTTGAAANMAIEFRAGTANQDFSINYVNNARTNGRSTAYVQATGVAGAYLKVQANSQGVANDGITVKIVDAATDKSVIWDKENNQILVHANVAGETLDVIAARMTAALGSTGLDAFTTTVVGNGAGAARFANNDSGVTRDGNLYDSIVVNLKTDANGVAVSTAAEVISAINTAGNGMEALGIRATNVNGSDGSGVAATGTLTLTQQGITATNQLASGTTFATAGSTARVTVAAKVTGAAYENVKIMFVAGADHGSEYATYDSSQKILTFHVNALSTSDEVATAFTTGSGTAASVKALFGVTGSGAGLVTANDIGWTGTVQSGVSYSGTSLGGVRSEGNFDAGEVVGTGGLEIRSTGYGTDAFVSIKALSGTFATTDSEGVGSNRSSGTDVNARINGIQAIGDGLRASINTSSLDVSFTIAATMAAGTSTSFTITAGGAQFQLGPDVVSNQQARLGIQSVNTSKLGGDNGQLYQLRSGGVASLSTDTTTAAKIVDEAIVSITTLRGRLGAFQKTTLETNIAALGDTLEALTDAESSIRDADFAAESANLTRAQILVQSGTSVLAMANQNPQNVLALLR